MLKLALNELIQISNKEIKSLKNEIVKAFIDQATAKSKIQTVLEKVRKLVIDSNNRNISIEEKVTHLKHQAFSIASSSVRFSYASVLGQASTTSSPILRGTTGPRLQTPSHTGATQVKLYHVPTTNHIPQIPCPITLTLVPPAQLHV